MNLSACVSLSVVSVQLFVIGWFTCQSAFLLGHWSVHLVACLYVLFDCLHLLASLSVFITLQSFLLYKFQPFPNWEIIVNSRSYL